MLKSEPSARNGYFSIVRFAAKKKPQSYCVQTAISKWFSQFIFMML